MEQEVLFIEYRAKESTGMYTDVLEAFVRIDGNPERDSLGEMLIASGFDFMGDEEEGEELLNRPGRWDYYGKIL